MKLARLALPAVVLPFALILTACSSDSGTAEKENKNSNAAASDSKSPAADEKSGEKNGFTVKELDKIALTGKVEGFTAKAIPQAEVAAGQGMKADKKECQPLTAAMGGQTLPASSVAVYRSLKPVEKTDATIGSMWLTALDEPDAKLVLKNLRKAVDDCPKGFETVGLKYTSVKSLKTAELGDESYAFQITGKIADQNMTTSYTVVREGAVVATFYGINMLTPKKSSIPEPVVTAQVKKISG
ncbi:hypothetical protein ACWCQM_01815 [Streptomyces sp. NPDC002125]